MRAPTSCLLRLTVLLALVVIAPSPAGARGVCPPGDPESPPIAFVGVALEGPTDPTTGQLVSPARFAVERWIAGDSQVVGAEAADNEVEVQTAVETAGEFFRFSSVGITPEARERWRIHGTGVREGVVQTSICEGSERLELEVALPEREVEPEPAPGPSEPGDDRALSLGVAAAGAAAIAVVLSRRWA